MKRLRVFLFFILIFTEIFSQTTYYVSSQGNNQSDGSFFSPWRTPGYACDRIQSGDTLKILKGEYILTDYSDDILRPPSGSAGKHTVITGEEGTVLKCGNNLFSAIDIGSGEYLTIKNLEITNNSDTYRDGITARDFNHSIICSVKIHHIDQIGIDMANVYDSDIFDCEITYCGFGSIGGPEGDHGGWREVRIERCNLSYSGHHYFPGDNPYDRPDGFGIEPSVGPILIRDCVAEHNKGDGLDSKSDSTTIERCIVANNSCDGVKLWGGGSKIVNTLIYGRGDGNDLTTPWSAIVIGTDDVGADFEIINVTIDDALGQNYVCHVQYDNPDVPINLTMKNVIWRSTGERGGIFVSGLTNLDISHCLFYFPNTGYVLDHSNQRFYHSYDIADLGEGMIYGNPLFVSPAWGQTGDYHLLPTSPAVDAGTNVDFLVCDLEGNPRPFNGIYDMGAYEWIDTVFDTIMNSPPQISDFQPQDSLIVMNWKDTIDFSVSCFDPDNDSLIILWNLFFHDSLLNHKTDTNLLASQWQFVAEDNEDSFFEVSCRVTDLQDTVFQPWKIEVRSVNQPPEILEIDDIVFAEDHDFYLDLNEFIIDPDDSVSEISWDFAIQEENIFVSIDTITKVLHLQAAENWFGDSNVLFLYAVDPGGLSDSSEIMISVTAVNDAPLPFDLIFPKNDTVMVCDSPIIFVWHESMEVDPDDFLSYRFELSSSEDFSTLEVNEIMDDTVFSPQFLFDHEKDFFWRVFAIDQDSAKTQCNEVFHFSIEVGTGLPEGEKKMIYSNQLLQNFPNPFCDKTNIRFCLEDNSHTIIKIYNLYGRLIATLIDQSLPKGWHEFKWNAQSADRNISSGIYYLQIKTDHYELSKKMLLLK